MAANKFALSDAHWERIRNCLPARNNTHPRGGGRKPRDDRMVFEAILFVLRYGIQWNALNATGLCPSSTVHDRFRKWVDAGFFHALAGEGLLAEPPLDSIDWSWLAVGGGMSRQPMARPARLEGGKGGARRRSVAASRRGRPRE